jgi:hypothetical protein
VSTVLEPDLLANARATQLGEMLREVKLFSRRADAPEDRAALAELERELLEIGKRWSSAGMLPNGLNGGEQ